MPKRTLFLILPLMIFSMAGCSSVYRDAQGRFYVRVVSHPPGAIVSTEDGVTKTTPAEFTVQPEMEVLFTLELEGYETATSIARAVGLEDPWESQWLRPLSFFIAGLVGKHRRLVPDPLSVDLVPKGERQSELFGYGEKIEFIWSWCSGTLDVHDDCSWLRGPTKEIFVRGVYARVAGSDENHSVLVVPVREDPDEWTFSRRRPGLRPCNRVYRAVLELGAKLERVIYIETEHIVRGCYMQFDRPFYSQLKAMTTQ